MLMTKAVQEGRLDIVEYLILSGMIPDKTKALLHEAVKNDDLAMVRCLGSYYDLSERDIYGDTPLHIVRSIPVAEWLVIHGAKADDKNSHDKYPYEVMPEGELRDWLEHKYRTLHPRIEEETFETASIEVPWESRFITRTVSVEDFRPVSMEGSSKFFLEYEGMTFSPSNRFLDSFARRMKISSNIFSLFSAEEVFDRIQDTHAIYYPKSYIRHSRKQNSRGS